VKNQQAPWGDVLMFENPGDELYFGEVYRQVLQEAWSPSVDSDWFRVGKSRRGYRPTQRGITSPNLSPAQSDVRHYFSLCAAAWRALPWDTPVDTVCDGRWGKDYWLKRKEEHGISCSYYDFYMRTCLSFALETGCIPPANYTLSLQASLSAVKCDVFYPISCSNSCGELSLHESNGVYVPGSGWKLEDCCGFFLEISALKTTLFPGETTTLWIEDPQPVGAGELKFQDSHGALGCLEYVLDPSSYCVYNWEIVSGGGSLDKSTGVSVHYTAPAIQPSCDARPLIRCFANGLSSGITIGVNSWPGNEPAFGIYKYSAPCDDPRSYCLEGSSFYVPGSLVIRYDCRGNVIDEVTGCPGTRSCTGSWCTCGESEHDPVYSFTNMCENSRQTCDGYGGYYWGQYKDLRTQAMIDGGCCPAEI